MKKVLTILILIVMLSGCELQNQDLDRMMSFRASLLSGMGCQFEAEVIADYQDELYNFTLECRCDEEGSLHFAVKEPERISGISGWINRAGGKLTFNDEKALAFETIADGQLTPVTAPWVLIKTLRSGYVKACGQEEDLLRVSIDDTYQDDALRLDVWFNADNKPEHAEILWKDRRILSLNVTNFEIL